MSILSIRNIHKSFGALEVLKGIDTDIARGEMVSIVGASGAGKTTLLQVMGTLLRPDEGSITLADTDVTRLGDAALSRFRNQHIGFIFQFHQLLPEFTALENVMLPALIAGQSKRAAATRAAELLDFMGLTRAPSTNPPNSRAANNNAWPPRAPSPTVPTLSSPMNPPVRSTRTTAPNCKPSSSVCAANWAKPSSS